MDAAADADARVAAFVSTQLRLVAAGSHRLAQLLGDAPLGPAVRARINALAYRPAALLWRARARATGRRSWSRSSSRASSTRACGSCTAQAIDEVEPLTVTLAQTLVRSRAAMTGLR